MQNLKNLKISNVSKVYLMGRSKVKFENLVASSVLALAIAFRAVGRCEKSGVPVLFGGHNLPLLIEIGLTTYQNPGPRTTGLALHIQFIT